MKLNNNDFHVNFNGKIFFTEDRQANNLFELVHSTLNKNVETKPKD